MDDNGRENLMTDEKNRKWTKATGLQVTGCSLQSYKYQVTGYMFTGYMCTGYIFIGYRVHVVGLQVTGNLMESKEMIRMEMRLMHQEAKVK